MKQWLINKSPTFSFFVLASVISYKQPCRHLGCVSVGKRWGGGSTQKHVLLQAYVGVNLALWARCWWQSKTWQREASESAGEATHCMFEKAAERTKRNGRRQHQRKHYHQALPSSSPLVFTYDIYSVTFNVKRTSADDNLSLFICHCILSPKEHHVNHTNWILSFLTNCLIKSTFHCLIILYSKQCVWFCTMLAVLSFNLWIRLLFSWQMCDQLGIKHVLTQRHLQCLQLVRDFRAVCVEPILSDFQM